MTDPTPCPTPDDCTHLGCACPPPWGEEDSEPATAPQSDEQDHAGPDHRGGDERAGEGL